VLPLEKKAAEGDEKEANEKRTNVFYSQYGTVNNEEIN
jgi:hypothetical protein